jgi:hypothetical protein
MNKSSQITNLLIPSLISLFNQYNDNLRTRLKADALLLSFDEKTQKTFNKFINLSNDRFKLMKYGGKLNHIISNQKQNYSKINNDIQNDLLFNTNYSNVERKKLIKSVNEFKSKEIVNVRDKLFESLKQRTSIDILLRKKQMMSRKDKNKKRNTTKKSTNGSKGSKVSFILPEESEKNENNKKTENKKNENKVEIIEKSPNEEIKEDHINFINGIESYKSLLNEKRNSINDVEKKSSGYYTNRFVKINKNDFKDIETTLNENNIKILSYNEEELNKKEKKKNEDATFDINQLYKIKNNNNNNYKNQMHFLPRLKPIETESSNFEFLDTNDNYDNKKQRSLTYNNNDMKNTIKIIRKEAYNGVMLGQKLLNQKKNFDMRYVRRFPKYFLDIYEQKNRLKQYKKEKNEEEHIIIPKIIKKRKLSKNEKIIEDFQKIYDNKKQIWKKEEKQKKINEKMKEKQQNDIINFLLNLKDRNIKKVKAK